LLAQFRHLCHGFIWRSENLIYVGSQVVSLSGMGYENEDGSLDGASLTWASSLDGDLGSRGSLAVSAASLQAGSHTLTLIARDVDGQTGTETRTIQVARQRPALPAALTVSPKAVLLQAAGGGGQALAIRNAGDGALTWSVTADQAWLVTSQDAGRAPANLTVAANPAGLALGEHQATLSVTSPEAGNSPQMVEVSLLVMEADRIYLPLVLRR
jgi:hypothetical protein